jgi:hypothetical protein
MGLAHNRDVDSIERALQATLDDRSQDVCLEAAQGILLLADQVEGDLKPALDVEIAALSSAEWPQVEQAE